MSTAFTPPSEHLPFGQRLLAGAIASVVVFALVQLMALLIPESGNVILRGWLLYGGMVAAGLAFISAVRDVPRK